MTGVRGALVKSGILRRRADSWLTLLLPLLDACYIAALLYICVLALDPTRINHAPSWLKWFGAPGNHATIAVVLSFPILHLALRRLAGKRPGPPLIVIAAMAASALILGMSAYWQCYGGQAPFFAPLAWTLALFLGNVQEPCGSMPIALEIARLLAIATTLTTALAAALTLFRDQLDRIAIRRARSLTVVLGVDDETISMVRAISRHTSGATLVALTDDAQSSAARAVHDLGARLRTVNLDQPDSISSLPLWNRLDRLYLLSADPMRNLGHFTVIDEQVGRVRGDRIRLPLIVRIDDPWQAEVWRRSFLASTKRRWVADAVGRYEITAAKVVRHMTTQVESSADLGPPMTVVLCGLHPLTYALASELAQLQRDQELYAKPHIVRPANVIIFAKGAQSFVDDHHIRQGRMAPDGTMLPVIAHDDEPTVDAITEYLRREDPAVHAVVLGDPSMETQGTRLASRFPLLRVYMASTSSTSLVSDSIVGHLFGFPINMELDEHAPQDVWERAAELIHEHYSSGKDRTRPAARPWDELDPFYQQSNRRQVLNALWMVETLADHTWNSLEQTGPAQPLPDGFTAMTWLDQLKVLGFEEETVAEMIKTEHEDWRRYYEDHEWKHDEDRNDERRRHDRLLPWHELVERDPHFAEGARESLAKTLISLRNLGYRSVPNVPKAAPPQPDETLQDVG